MRVNGEFWAERPVEFETRIYSGKVILFLRCSKHVSSG